MNQAEGNQPEAGMYLTRFYHTDRTSEIIDRVEKSKDRTKFFTADGFEYLYMNGKIRIGRTVLKNARITTTDQSYFDPSF